MNYYEVATKIDVSSAGFIGIREDNLIYVDKTQFIYQLAFDKNFRFLSRPRRFGKSTIVDTLEELFLHGVKPYDGHDSYFKGLDIEKLWTDDKQYAVMRLDFSHFTTEERHNLEAFKQALKDKVKKFAQKFALIFDDNLSAIKNLDQIFENAPSKSIVFLIDEYDVPLTENPDDQKIFTEISSVLKDLYSLFKTHSRKLRSVFVTGITRYKDASFFTLGNTIKDISQDPAYSTIAGLARDEIKKYYQDNLTYSASVVFKVAPNEVTEEQKEKLLDKLEYYYDGYCFDEQCSHKVFSTWSVLNFFLSEYALFNNYWYSSGGLPSILVKSLNRIRQDIFKLLQNEEYIVVSQDDFENPTSYSSMKAPVLLFQAGYLTFAAPKGESNYKLKYPNHEVSQSISKHLVNQVFSNQSGFNKLLESKLDQFKSVDEIVNFFNSILNLVDYEYYPIDSEDAVVNCIYLFLKGEDKLKTSVNSHSSLGRCDLQIDSETRRLVLEFKFAKNEAEEAKLLEKAIAQIKEKKYGQTADAPTEIVSLALVFNQVKRQITKYKKVVA